MPKMLKWSHKCRLGVTPIDLSVPNASPGHSPKPRIDSIRWFTALVANGERSSVGPYNYLSSPINPSSFPPFSWVPAAEPPS